MTNSDKTGAAVSPDTGTKPIIFVWQKFSAYGGAELLLDRTMAALVARGRKVAIIAADWPQDYSGPNVIDCPLPRAPRAFRATLFARRAERIFREYPDALLQANQPIPGCNILRTSGGIHAAYLKHRAFGEGALRGLWPKFSLFHRNALRLERETFADNRLEAVIANSAMVKQEVIDTYGLRPERVHHISNGVDADASIIASLPGRASRMAIGCKRGKRFF